MKLNHPATKNPIEVSDDSAPLYQSQGWVEVVPEAAPKSTTDRASGKSGTAPRTTTKKEEA